MKDLTGMCRENFLLCVTSSGSREAHPKVSPFARQRREDRMVSWARPCEGKAMQRERDKISQTANGARHVQQRPLRPHLIIILEHRPLFIIIQAQPRLHKITRPSSNASVVDVVFTVIIGHQHLVIRTPSKLAATSPLQLDSV